VTLTGTRRTICDALPRKHCGALPAGLLKLHTTRHQVHVLFRARHHHAARFPAPSRRASPSQFTAAVTARAGTLRRFCAALPATARRLHYPRCPPGFLLLHWDLVAFLGSWEQGATLAWGTCAARTACAGRQAGSAPAHLPRSLPRAVSVTDCISGQPSLPLFQAVAPVTLQFCSRLSRVRAMAYRRYRLSLSRDLSTARALAHAAPPRWLSFAGHLGGRNAPRRAARMPAPPTRTTTLAALFAGWLHASAAGGAQ